MLRGSMCRSKVQADIITHLNDAMTGVTKAQMHTRELVAGYHCFVKQQSSSCKLQGRGLVDICICEVCAYEVARFYL